VEKMKLWFLLFLFLPFVTPTSDDMYEREVTIPTLPFCRKGHVMGLVKDGKEDYLLMFGGKGFFDFLILVDFQMRDVVICWGEMVDRKDYILKKHGQSTLNDIWSLQVIYGVFLSHHFILFCH